MEQKMSSKSPMFLFVLLFCGMALLGIGCTSVRLRGPVAEVMPPRPIQQDDWAWDVIKYKSEYQFTLTEDASERPPTLNTVKESTLDKKGFVHTGLSYGLIQNLSVGFDLAGGLAPRVQYTIPIGSDDGGRSQYLSVFASYQADSSSIGGDQKGKYGPGGYPWRASAKTTEKMLGVSYGLRATESSMMYLGVAHNEFSSSADIDQSAAPENGAAAAQYNVSASGRSNTVALGIVVGAKDSLDLSAAYSTFWLEDYTKSDIQYSVRYSTPMDFMKPQTDFETIQKDTWKGSDVGALALSYFVGCGTGQAMQDNWERKGKYFCMADVTAAALILQSFSNVAGKGAGNSSGSGGAILYIVSRIWQVVDVIQDAGSSSKKVAKAKP